MLPFFVCVVVSNTMKARPQKGGFWVKPSLSLSSPASEVFSGIDGKFINQHNSFVGRVILTRYPQFTSPSLH